MGSLVAWHYPTNLLAGQADHTYVACGNGGHELSVRQFVDAFNELTIELQERSAEILDEGRYRALFEQAPEEKIVLADPAVAQAAYPAR